MKKKKKKNSSFQLNLKKIKKKREEKECKIDLILSYLLNSEIYYLILFLFHCLEFTNS